MSKWISVKEKLPDDGNWVLAWSRDDQCQCLAHLDGQHDGKWNWYVMPGISRSFRSTGAVTHWMLLPEPPKPEGPFVYKNGIIYFSPKCRILGDYDFEGCAFYPPDLIDWINKMLTLVN